MADLVGTACRLRGCDERGKVRAVLAGPEGHVFLIVEDSGGNLRRVFHDQVVIIPA